MTHVSSTEIRIRIGRHTETKFFYRDLIKNFLKKTLKRNTNSLTSVDQWNAKTKLTFIWGRKYLILLVNQSTMASLIITAKIITLLQKVLISLINSSYSICYATNLKSIRGKKSKP